MRFLGVLPWGWRRALDMQTGVAPERLNRDRQDHGAGADSAEKDKGG